MPEQNGILWVKLSDFARVYNRSSDAIRLWCESGFCVELGFTVRRDVTGHWLIGVPLSHPEAENFRAVSH